jgi:hemoglobin
VALAGSEDSVYARVGGMAFFTALVDRFYAAVEADPVLRPLYPDDLAPGKANLAEFLAQYWGGPPAYSARRGHPRLRMRHAHFAIGEREREAWVKHMTAAVRGSGAGPEEVDAMAAYFRDAAAMLVNRAG